MLRKSVRKYARFPSSYALFNICDAIGRLLSEEVWCCFEAKAVAVAVEAAECIALLERRTMKHRVLQ